MRPTREVEDLGASRATCAVELLCRTHSISRTKSW
jgi:hypothetical protein